MDNKIEYNPEGSALRRDQLELLRLLTIVAGICKENDIPWWLSSGTLLGAARHRGFIPWDDDIDIVLLKKDYKKLEKILCNYKSNEFVFHCQKTDIDYINEFGKFRKREGRVESLSNRYKYYKWTGIGFDIFSMEKTSRFSAVAADYLAKGLNRLSYRIDRAWIRKPLILITRFFLHCIIYPILRLIGLINPDEEYHYVLGTGWPHHTFYMKYTFPLSSTDFEGIQFPVPHDMDSYLTNVFGDWRTMPSEAQILASIHNQEYKNEILARQVGNNL